MQKFVMPTVTHARVLAILLIAETNHKVTTQNEEVVIDSTNKREAELAAQVAALTFGDAAQFLHEVRQYTYPPINHV